MRLLGGKGNLKYFLTIFVFFLALSPGSILPNIIQPVFAQSAAAGNSTPTSYALAEWKVPTPGGGPWGVTVDQFGKIWFTENVTSKLARFDPTNNNFTEWSVPGGGNPRYVFTKQDMSGGRNVTRVYFTEYSSNKIGYFNSWNATFYEWQLPTGSNPVGIFVDANYTIWFTESGRDSIGRLTPSTNQLTVWTLPGGTTNPGAPLLEPWGIYVQSALTGIYHNVTDRFVWFTETANNAIGRLQVTNNLLILWDLNSLGIIPGLKYGPTDIMVDSTTPGNVIFSSSLGDRISVLQNCGTTCTGYNEYALPSRTTIAKPTSVAYDSSQGLIWFTEYNSGVVATASTATQANQATVPNSSPCIFPPSAGPPICASPSGYSTATVTPIITNNVQGVSTIGAPQPNSMPLFQGPINGINEYILPNNTARPNFATIDTSGNIWITENNPNVNRIGRVSFPYDFQLTVSPTSQAFQVGGSATYGVTVSVTSGVPYPVQLAINTPPGINANFNPSVGTPQASKPFSSTLLVSSSNSTNPGTYTMNVTATSGGVTHAFQINLIITPLPPPVTFDYNIDATGNVTVSVVQGQQATFQFQISPSTTASPKQVNLTVNQNLLPPGVTVARLINANGKPPFSSVLALQTSITTPAGPYDLTNLITGLSAGLAPHHPRETVMLTVTETARDFNLTISSTAVNVVQASRLDLITTITSIGPFAGDVSLSGRFSPSDTGLTVTFSPPILSPLPNGGMAQATMEIIAQRSTPGRTYQLTVTAVSGVPSRIHQVTVSVHVSPCLIASATFESELAPEVQFLRDFRDQQILHTFAGSAFMDLFNSWYYSFSPNVAEYESGHAVTRELLRVLLYPLIGILHVSSEIYTIVGFQPEIGVLAAGVLASTLIGFVYLSLPTMGLFLVFRRRLNSQTRRRVWRWMTCLAGLLMICYVVSEILRLPLAMMYASSGIVITFLLVGVIIPVTVTAKLIRRLK